MVSSNIFALVGISVLGCAQISLAACSRPVLQTTLDNLFRSIENARAPSVKLASSVKISLNNAVVKSIAETSFRNFTKWAKPSQIKVLDETTCNVAAMSIPKYGNNTQILSTRMQMTPTGEATELEVFVTGGNTNYIFFGDYLSETPGDIWNEKNPAPRAELLKCVDSYASAITAGKSNMVEVSPTCSRYENGFKIGNNLAKGQIGLGFGQCNAGFELIKVPVTDRRWYIDTETGIGFGNFNFAVALWLHESFKVKDGKIEQIYAGMIPNFWSVPNDPWSPPKVE